MGKIQKSKKYPFCTIQNCECDNSKNDHDYPTVQSVNDWRDCLLCLLSEILANQKTTRGE